jgi:hypothetical protein
MPSLHKSHVSTCSTFGSKGVGSPFVQGNELARPMPYIISVDLEMIYFFVEKSAAIGHV